MVKILFICHGNICRSPMAEFIFKHKAAERGVSHLFAVASAATSTEEIWNGVGNPVYPPAKRELKKHGIACDGKRAVQVTRADYGKYDYILCADDRNVKNTIRITGGDPDNKIMRLLDFSDDPRSIADPWYTGVFDITYSDIDEGLRAFLKYLGYI